MVVLQRLRRVDDDAGLCVFLKAGTGHGQRISANAHIGKAIGACAIRNFCPLLASSRIGQADQCAGDDGSGGVRDRTVEGCVVLRPSPGSKRHEHGERCETDRNTPPRRALGRG